MLKISRSLGLCSVGVILLTVTAPLTAVAQSEVAQEKIVATAVNKPLSSLRETADRTRNNPVVPGAPRQVLNFSGFGQPVSDLDSSAPDPLLQQQAGQQATLPGSGFFGASNNDNGSVLGFLIAPPDTDGQVGPNHFVQMINLLTTVFDKSGNIDMGPFPSNVLWTGIGGNCQAYNQGDPVVLYDDQADRWLVSQFAFPDSLNSFSQCVAISQTGDPTGDWNRYEFSFNNIGFNDYPKHGIVSNSITMMANLFRKKGQQLRWAGTFLGVMDKAAMYAGDTASLIGFNIGKAEFGFVAGDLDGPSSVDVPALFGTAMSQSSMFDIWQLDVDWSNGNASRSRIASIPITPFNSTLCSASRGECIPQPNNGPRLESLSDRLMHRLQIRDFGGYRSMVAAHTVNVGGGRAGIRWYEMRESGGAWGLYQEGTFAPNDGLHRWMPSIAMNTVGDIGIGYLLASTGTFVSTAAAGQSFSATGTGILDSDELLCAAGTGVQEGVSRSGDYSSTSVDPVDDTFWHTNEVFTQSGNFQWNTFICEFSVEGGGGGNNPPTAGFGFACTELACNFTDNSTDTDGTVDIWSWDFGDGGSSSAQNPDHTYAADGTYTVTLTVTDNDGDSDLDSQTVSPTAGGGVSLSGSAIRNGKTWTAIVTDAGGSNLQGSWSYNGGSASCTGSGECRLRGIPKKRKSVIFTASPGGETITISRP